MKFQEVQEELRRKNYYYPTLLDIGVRDGTKDVTLVWFNEIRLIVCVAYSFTGVCTIKYELCALRCLFIYRNCVHTCTYHSHSEESRNCTIKIRLRWVEEGREEEAHLPGYAILMIYKQHCKPPELIEFLNSFIR